jgi:two-component system, OmpR family, sensor kinase
MAPLDPTAGPVLTRRQREVVVLLARGLTNRQIGHELGLSEGRVANLVRSARAALGHRSRAHLAAWAVESGLTGAPDRLLGVAERLLQTSATDLPSALVAVADVVADALDAEKVDAFLLDPPSATLVAVGTSTTPLGRKQKACGLDHLPLANGGRTVQVFRAHVPFATGHLEDDPEELPGVVHLLGIRSLLAVPLTVADDRRGVLLASSTATEFFTERDLRFLEVVARWAGLVAARALRDHGAAAAAADQRRRAAVRDLAEAVSEDLVGQADGKSGMQRLHALLLEVAAVEQGAMQLYSTTVDLELVLRQAARAAGVALSWAARQPPARPVSGHPQRLAQAFELVFSVAPRQAVSVELDSESADSGDTARVAIRAHGSARPAARACQAPSLGLYLARRIIECHGGSLTCDPAAPGGASYVVRLPVGPP